MDASARCVHLLGVSPRVDSAQTLYRQVHRVPSGSVLRMGVDGVRGRDALVRLRAPPRSESVDDLSHELRDQIASAVERASTPFDDVALSVSGGVDSSSLLAIILDLARKSSRPRVHALNVTFAGLGDSRPHFRSLCVRLGVVPSQIQPSECASSLFDSLVVDGTPVRWVNACCELRLTQMSRELGASVLLSGGGGDAVFEGDIRVIADRARQGHLISALHTAATLKGLGSSTARGRIRALVLSPLLRMLMGPRLRRELRSHRHARAFTWAGPRLRSWIDEVRPLDGEAFAPSRDRDWLHEMATSSCILRISRILAVSWRPPVGARGPSHSLTMIWWNSSDQFLSRHSFTADGCAVYFGIRCAACCPTPCDCGRTRLTSRKRSSELVQATRRLRRLRAPCSQ